MKPAYIAYKVIDLGKDKASVWYKVGAIWPHKNGSGFDVVIPEGVSVSGRIVCIQPKADEEEQVPGAQG